MSNTYSPRDRQPNVVAWQCENIIGTYLQAGRCWSFLGSNDHLGIFLADDVTVTSVIVEHTSINLLPQPDIAPQDIVVWAQVEDDSVTALYCSHHQLKHHSSVISDRCRQSSQCHDTCQLCPYHLIHLRRVFQAFPSNLHDLG